jgi:hypothetical protein
MHLPAGMDTYSPAHCPAPLETRIDTAISQFDTWRRDAGAQWDAAVRARPRQSMALALAAGAIGRQLPLAVLLRSGLRLLWTVAPPVLAVVGAIKVARVLRGLDDGQQPFRTAESGTSRREESFPRPDDRQPPAREPGGMIVLPDAISPPAVPASGVHA